MIQGLFRFCRRYHFYRKYGITVIYCFCSIRIRNDSLCRNSLLCSYNDVNTRLRALTQYFRLSFPFLLLHFRSGSPKPWRYAKVAKVSLSNLIFRFEDAIFALQQLPTHWKVYHTLKRICTGIVRAVVETLQIQ